MSGFSALNDDEMQFINYLDIMTEDDGIICPEEFNYDDDYCKNCESFDICFLREIKKRIEL